MKTSFKSAFPSWFFVFFVPGLVFVCSCSPLKLEEPDAGRKVVEKNKAKVKKNPFANMTPVLLGKHSKGVTHVQWSPDGKFVVSTGRDGMIKLWSVSEHKLVREFKGHTKRVMMAAFSKDGTKLVSASFDQTARVWDVATGKCLAILKEKPPKKKLTEQEQAALDALPEPQVNWAVFTKDGTGVITASDDFALKHWDAKTGKLLNKFVDEGCRQRRVMRRRDASGWVSSAGCMDDGVSYIKFWNDKGQVVGVKGDERHDAHYVAFDSQNRFMVAADGSTFLNVFSAQGSFLKQVMVGTYHFCLVFGPSDETLLVGTDGGQIVVYKVDGWSRVGKLDMGKAVAIDSMSLNPVDNSLAVGLRDGRVMIFTQPVRLPK